METRKERNAELRRRYNETMDMVNNLMAELEQMTEEECEQFHADNRHLNS